MKEIMNYKLLYCKSRTIQDFDKIVNQYISNGWRLYGAPFRMKLELERYETVAQAVVKYKN